MKNLNGSHDANRLQCLPRPKRWDASGGVNSGMNCEVHVHAALWQLPCAVAHPPAAPAAALQQLPCAVAHPPAAPAAAVCRPLPPPQLQQLPCAAAHHGVRALVVQQPARRKRVRHGGDLCVCQHLHFKLRTWRACHTCYTRYTCAGGMHIAQPRVATMHSRAGWRPRVHALLGGSRHACTAGPGRR
eukprot:362529-Chlamydomonas_euryale.AAC.2